MFLGNISNSASEMLEDLNIPCSSLQNQVNDFMALDHLEIDLMELTKMEYTDDYDSTLYSQLVKVFSSHL